MARKHDVEDEEGLEEFEGEDPLAEESLDGDGDEASYLLGWCRACKANRSHTVVEEVDDEEDDDDSQVVLCTECGDEHALEAPRHKTRRVAKAAKTTSSLVDEADLMSPEKVAATWSRLTRDVTEENVMAYTPRQVYKVADVVKHTAFGIGVVFATLSPTKVEVLFEDKARRLVCNR